MDSSACTEFFVDGPNADAFADAIEDTANLVVPSICLFETFKVIARRRDVDSALIAVAALQRGTVVDLDAALALAAAVIGLEHKLPLADSIVYATAERVGGVVWTQDDDFEGLALARYVPKRSSR